MHRIGGVGIGGLKAAAAQREAAAAVGREMREAHDVHVASQMATFRAHLEEFARKHRADINRDPAFRHAFARMTRSLGVDPLASSKGLWGEVLGVGDFFFELAVQIIDVCVATRALNGGLISLDDLQRRLTRIRGGAALAASAATTTKRQAITASDVETALEKLAVLGGGYRIVDVGGARYVVSVPAELNADHTVVLRTVSRAAAGAGGSGAGASASASTGYTTLPALCTELGWDIGRAKKALDWLLGEGMAWLDTGHPGMREEGPRYYFPAIDPSRA